MVGLFLVVSASFNISSSLFVSVLKRYGDLGILKAMGASEKFLVRLFSLQGLMFGAVGSLMGVLLGLGLGFTLVHTRFFQLSGEIYKLDHLTMEIRAVDMFAVFLATLVICLFATLAPARRGARLNPVDGLRYE